MYKQAHLLPSAPMGRKIYLWQYGTYGMPVLVFPSASGMAHEWESNGMVEALGDLIGRRIKLYCVESNVAEAWTRKENDPRWRIQRHLAYEQFVLDELVPFIRHDCRTEGIPITVTGTSLGAFYSANFVLKQPETFRHALCLSGTFDMTNFAAGLDDDDIYYNNPMAYVANLHGEHLDRVREHAHLTLVCGRGKYEDGNWQETESFAGLLASKQISHRLDLWGYDVAHDWSWWRRQAVHHLRDVFGA